MNGRTGVDVSKVTVQARSPSKGVIRIPAQEFIMMRRLIPFFAALLALLGPLPAQAKPRFFVQLRAVREAPKSTCHLAKKASQLVKATLAKVGMITLDLGVPLPKAKDALAALLKKRKLTGYAIVFRITRCRHELKPPAPGKAYKTLAVDVATAVDAEKIPSGQIALAGTGDAQVQTEVTRIKPSELASLRDDALKSATEQSIGRFVKTLSQKPKRHRRRHRRTRRRH